MPQRIVNRISVAVIVLSILTGVALRLAQLGVVPLGLHPDEAVNGYDAYSILKTGRDHHGNFLPIVMQGFNDYRMPLFQYSLVPLIGWFGLKASVVRLGAAIWGIVDLLGVTAIATVMLGLPGAAATALLYALSPWHLPFSRLGLEMSAASATVTLAMLGFFLWLKYRKGGWLLASGMLFGISFYAYSINQAVTPLMIGLLAITYWREIRSAGIQATIAVVIVILLAAPQVSLTITRRSELQGRLLQSSISSYTCGTCTAEWSLWRNLENAGAGCLSYFTPSFLFIDGDRGDHWTLTHPPGFGQLLPEQALLIALALAPLFSRERRKLLDQPHPTRKKRAAESDAQEIASRRRKDFAVLLIGWLILAGLPAAALVPLGAYQPEPNAAVPTAWMLMDHSVPSVPLTPWLLFSHPDSRHAVFQMVPWTLLSALGFVTLLEFSSISVTLRAAAATTLMVGIVCHGTRFVRSYFREYPIIAAPYFQYGMDEVVRTIQGVADPHQPVVITPRINQPYIYVLFYECYSPAKFQHFPAWQANQLFAPVIQFGNHLFMMPGRVYPSLAHGTLVFSGAEQVPAPGAKSIYYPDGRLAFTILSK